MSRASPPPFLAPRSLLRLYGAYQSQSSLYIVDQAWNKRVGKTRMSRDVVGIVWAGWMS